MYYIYIYIYVLLHVNMFTLLDACVSSLRRGHANLLCIVPISTDDPRRESKFRTSFASRGLTFTTTYKKQLATGACCRGSRR